ncbi:hypothetical protein RJE46_14160 [Cedecea neteri]|uniref:hypothetical protein n=1 Tax=Cedecea neteri TaxID=158822 RepID=UPI002892ED44|nr:hypothetical protein [Cedecea neteri]WNJ77776.1 hypothetical protein RJE46_14160 [Cedecea neteri]
MSSWKLAFFAASAWSAGIAAGWLGVSVVLWEFQSVNPGMALRIFVVIWGFPFAMAALCEAYRKINKMLEGVRACQ